MSEEITNGAAAPVDAATGPAFTVEKLYVKDVSFEVPGAPGVFNESAQPQLQMNLNQSVQRLNDNAYEVVLGITLTCTANDKSLYLVEVKQAGVFGLPGFDAQTLDRPSWRLAGFHGEYAGKLPDAHAGSLCEPLH